MNTNKKKALTILLVQPDGARAAQMRRALEARGHRVDVAPDGVAAADRIARDRHEWVVAEAILPEKSGFALCQEFTRGGGTTAFVITTDVDDTFVRGLARECGARAVLRHPIGDESLVAALEATYARPDVSALLREREGRIRRGELRPPSQFSFEADSAGFMDGLLDSGTGLCNHTYLVVKLAEEFKKSRRYGLPLSCLVVSLDGYESTAARGDEEVAEEIYARVAGLVLTQTRDVDFAGRAGPGRYLVLLPSTGRPGAEVVAKRLVSVLGEALGEDGESLAPVRIGIATYPSESITTAEGFVRAAEESLERARAANKALA
ncbi:MAG: diguanylate cyclase [Planctomycetes bacterium]|nr:diguanylate cyclase [Planctomycetota bacterium]MBI3843335.1 diguanylate cyclase [Planctomycetota bacterium]